MDTPEVATPTSGAATPLTVPSTPAKPGFIPLVTVVDFHHARGPEVEMWFGAAEGTDPAVEYDWGLLPFMALSDGAHLSSEDFSYFTLLRPATATGPATSLFGISCTRQLDASQLLNRPAEVTRSTVQKAVVVIADTPQHFGMMRERLSVVTQAWFAQREFTDTEILRRFQESLAEEKERGFLTEEESRDQYLGMSLRELVHEFKWQTLMLFKCCLLQPKMLFFGSRCERLCMMQFSLISLIPGLIRNLIDCADPELNNYEKKLARPTSLRTSDRNSLLTYMGLPLQIFGKGSLFGPYTPLQQLDILADFGTKSYIVGSTNSLLLQQKDRYSDILINLDEHTVNVTSSSLRNALALSAADRRWIDYITQVVNDTWDDANPQRPNTMGYVGSEEFIRLQFEEYILSLVSSVKYHNHLLANPNNPRALLPHIEGDPSLDYGSDFVESWSRTENHRIWNANTDSHLFDVVEPRHPCAGGLTIDDVQRRIAQQVQDMHLDERLAVGKEVLGRNFAVGKEKASNMFNKFYADMEAFREAQRKRAEEQRIAAEAAAAQAEKAGGPAAASTTSPGGAGDATKAQSNAPASGNKATSYVSSWVTWAGEKRKAGWGGGGGASGSSSPTTTSSGGGYGWGRGWGKSKTDANKSGNSEKDSASVSGSRVSTSSAGVDINQKQPSDRHDFQPLTQGSYTDSVFSAGTVDSERPASPVADRRPQSKEGPSVATDAVDATTPTTATAASGSDGRLNGGESLTIKPVVPDADKDEEQMTAPPAAAAAAAAATTATKAQQPEHESDDDDDADVKESRATAAAAEAAAEAAKAWSSDR
ncbi:cytoplasm protein [Colletotrichum tofieldiae]|uniref:Cytoplasm protein (Transporter Avl9) n=1 Tax=Colletotrichum tofieldiae TaxID=708197 RepID=A0A166MKW1_9PEZI|nr:cytoplasm protein (transporter Avl9) [Colletotrichum tofieldiae]GKT59132.1 cytoplasm protein [Colletotrichum tofieldiae]GKT80152.1 cytoplasm protein [Colletotrichum tofieldiae]